MKIKGKSFPSHKAGVMNSTEKSYSLHLDLLKIAGRIKEYYFEVVTLKLAKNTRYTPDFMVINSNDEIEFHEVKGFWRDDARVKIKVAAEMYPFIFKAYCFKGKKWAEEDLTAK